MLSDTNLYPVSTFAVPHVSGQLVFVVSGFAVGASIALNCALTCHRQPVCTGGLDTEICKPDKSDDA
jgi:hypothetical protein